MEKNPLIEDDFIIVRRNPDEPEELDFYAGPEEIRNVGIRSKWSRHPERAVRFKSEEEAKAENPRNIFGATMVVQARQIRQSAVQ